MENNILPLKLESGQNDIYADFGPRLSSLLIDTAFIAPVVFGIYYINSFNSSFYFITIIPFLIFNVWYNVYMPKKYGGTLGKLIMGIKIIRLDGSDIGWREAFLRNAVELFFFVLSIIIHVYGLTQIDEVVWSNLSWAKQTKYLKSFSPVFSKTQLWASNIWIVSELVVLKTNPRKRALHDYIAGTVVVKSIYIDEIRVSIPSDYSN